MPIDSFKTRLAQHIKINIELIVNENQSTMLNLLEKNTEFARLSVHKMFLQAPDYVILAIAHYINGTRKGSYILRQYIQDHFWKCDYTYLVNQRKLLHAGSNYNLKCMYEELNRKYFNNELNLSITWYGKEKKKKRGRITFGQYLSGLRLIKIHRLLDDCFFPEYFIAFVIYHEMLHSVVAGSVDVRGRYCVHDATFKKREMIFEHYHQAIEWERNNKIKLFSYS